MRAFFQKAESRKGELQLVCALSVAAASATFLSVSGDHKTFPEELGVMDPYVERSIELGSVSRSGDAFGTIEFVKADTQTNAPVTSRVIATIHARDGSPVDASAIEHVVLGVRPNQLFQSALADEDQWTEKTGPVLRQLSPTDRTFVLLWARGYRLTSVTAARDGRRPTSADPGFLELGEDFSPGKPIRLDLVVEREGLPFLRARQLSAEGTRAELPPFRE